MTLEEAKPKIIWPILDQYKKKVVETGEGDCANDFAKLDIARSALLAKIKALGGQSEEIARYFESQCDSIESRYLSTSWLDWLGQYRQGTRVSTEGRVMLETWLGKRVRVSMSSWETDRFMPELYVGVISGVFGTMFLLTEMKTFVGMDNMPDTWMNTSSPLLNFIQLE